MGATVSLSSPIVAMSGELCPQSGDLYILDLKGHPVFRLSLSKIYVDAAYHLYPIAVLSSEQTNLFRVML